MAERPSREALVRERLALAAGAIGCLDTANADAVEAAPRRVLAAVTVFEALDARPRRWVAQSSVAQSGAAAHRRPAACAAPAEPRRIAERRSALAEACCARIAAGASALAGDRIAGRPRLAVFLGRIARDAAVPNAVAPSQAIALALGILEAQHARAAARIADLGRVGTGTAIRLARLGCDLGGRIGRDLRGGVAYERVRVRRVGEDREAQLAVTPGGADEQTR